MRWDTLFADLEAQLEEEDRAGFEAEVADRTRVERGAVLLADRLRAQGGRMLGFRLADGDSLRGQVVGAGKDWLLVRGAAGDVLLPLTAVVAVEGLAPGVLGADGPLASRLPLSSVLRGLSRDRVQIVLDTTGGRRVGGVIERVGADHLDLGTTDGDARRVPMTVPYAAVLRLVVDRGASA